MIGSITAFDGNAGTIQSSDGEELSFQRRDVSSFLDSAHILPGAEVLYRRVGDIPDLKARDIVIRAVDLTRREIPQSAPSNGTGAIHGVGSIRIRSIDEPMASKNAVSWTKPRVLPQKTAKPAITKRPPGPDEDLVRTGLVGAIDTDSAVLCGDKRDERWTISSSNLRHPEHFKDLQVGDRIEYRVKRRVEGIVAADVFSPRLASASPDHDAIEPELVAPHILSTGRVKALRDEFGFIVGDDGSDYYFNARKMVFPSEFASLTKGDRVIFHMRRHPAGERVYADVVVRVLVPELQEADALLTTAEQDDPRVVFPPATGGVRQPVDGIQRGVVMAGEDSLPFIATSDGRRIAFHRNEIILPAHRDFISVGHQVAFFTRGQNQSLTAIDVTLICSNLPENERGVLGGIVALCNWRSGLIRGDDGSEYSFKRTGSLMPGTRVVFEKGSMGKRVRHANSVVVDYGGKPVAAVAPWEVSALMQCIEADPSYTAFGPDAKSAVAQLIQMAAPQLMPDSPVQIDLPSRNILQKVAALLPQFMTGKKSL